VVGGFRSAAAEAGEIASVKAITTTRSAITDSLDNFFYTSCLLLLRSKADPHRASA